ncbi:hypothetical protein ACFOON_15105 [Novosphingobium piscinae]|uniref:Uncharacterized protein n=1 Tax=Novosphingobium piscinae TaxID=1507448 RepID=A0A7X1KPI0_9SPHN|nr:hypothetical protein [Novosphingobium piscinae]MBC2668771.1 hypothetical protein [Novosphingobium piscinae]
MRLQSAPRNVANSPARPRVIDWTNPLTRGLIACITVRNGQMVDLVNRNRTFTPTGKTMGYGTNGPMVRAALTGAENVLSSPAIETASGDWTYHILSRFTTSAGNGSMVATRPAGTYVSFGWASGGTTFAVWHSGRGNQLTPTPALTLPTSGWNVLSVRSSAAANQIGVMLNGGPLSTTTGFLDAPMTAILGDSNTVNRGWFDTPLMLVFNRPQTDIVMRRLARDPWQIFRRESRPLSVATQVSTTAIAADLVARATLSAALTPTKPIGSALQAATGLAPALGSITKPIGSALLGTTVASSALSSITKPIGAGAVASSAAAAALSTLTKPLAASLAARATVAGVLTLTVPLSAVLTAVAAVAGAIGDATGLAVSVSSSSSITASLSPTKPIGAALVGTSSAAASIASAEGLSVALTAVSAVSAALTPAKPLAAAAVAGSAITGELVLTKPIGAALASTSMAALVLPAGSGLSASLVATSSATAALALTKPLDGAAVAQSSVAGDLRLTVRIGAALTARSAVTAILSSGPAYQPTVVRYVRLPKIQRYFLLPAIARRFNLPKDIYMQKLPNKHASASYDTTFGYADRIDAGDSIADWSVTLVIGDVVVTKKSQIGMDVTFNVAGGTAGRQCEFVVAVNTVGGRTFSDSVFVKVVG